MTLFLEVSPSNFRPCTEEEAQSSKLTVWGYHQNPLRFKVNEDGSLEQANSPSFPSPYPTMTTTEQMRNEFLNIIRTQAHDNGATYEEAVGALEVVKEIMLREAVNEYHQKVKPDCTLGTP